MRLIKNNTIDTIHKVNTVRNLTYWIEHRHLKMLKVYQSKRKHLIFAFFVFFVMTIFTNYPIYY